jgi:hypothetical protein
MKGGELSLECAIGSGEPRMRAEAVAKREEVPPAVGRLLSYVEVVGPPRDAWGAERFQRLLVVGLRGVHPAKNSERADRVRKMLPRVHDCHHVDDRLGGHTRYGCTADVFDGTGQPWAENGFDPLTLCLEIAWP